MNNMNGQTSIEFVVLLAVSLIFFSVIMIIASDQISVLSKSQAREKALLTIKEIASAIDEVYAEGKGAKREVLVSFQGAEQGSFRIVNKTVIVRIYGTDISQKLNAPVPDTTLPIGNYYLEIISFGNIVSIGIPPFLVSPSSVSLAVCSPNETYELYYNITFQNNANESIIINLQKNWSNDVNLTIENQVSLTINESKNSQLNFSIPANLIGLKSGKIIASTETSTANYTTFIPISLNLISCAGGGGVSYLIIDTYNESTYTNKSDNFYLPPNVTITTGNWPPNSNITIKIINPNAQVIYENTTQTNSTGEYSFVLKVFGPIGIYTINVNDSSMLINTTFELISCG